MSKFVKEAIYPSIIPVLFAVIAGYGTIRAMASVIVDDLTEATEQIAKNTELIREVSAQVREDRAKNEALRGATTKELEGVHDRLNRHIDECKPDIEVNKAEIKVLKERITNGN
jgi:chromosome segregation ATPase